MINSSAWERAVISEIAIAVLVAPANKKAVHTDRPYHGLVINTPGSGRTYYFSDGTVLRTEENEMFYLPKGSSYRAEPLHTGENNSCYAINFDADLSDAPFGITFRNPEPIIRLFKTAADEWKRQNQYCDITVRKILYELILAAAKEHQRKYVPPSTDALILPAVERMRSEFNESELSVTELAAECGISEAYFRRIFLNRYGISPKEYIINMRMNYAKQLLSTGELPISNVATLCGYAEPTHFSREFSRRVGIAPNKYKDSVK